jgi:hypothetical protein
MNQELRLRDVNDFISQTKKIEDEEIKKSLWAKISSFTYCVKVDDAL